MKKIIGAAIAALFLFAAPVAAATYSITLNESDPHLGSVITFTVTGVPTHQIKNPRIEVDCYQNGVLVYGEGGGYADFFTLGAGSDWVSGPADCIATLFYFDNHGPTQQAVILATTGFTAGA